MGGSRPRVALVHPYWDFWERSVAYDLRADREALAEEVRSRLAVDWVEGDEAECVLVLETMASPPAWTLDELPPLPLVVWAAHRWSTIPDDFDHGGITAEGGTVGTPMLTSVLVRQHRPFELVVGRISDERVCQAVETGLHAAAAARRVRGARIARVGAPQPGYSCVDTPDEQLERALGLQVVRLEPEEFAARYDTVDPDHAARVRTETDALYDVQVAGEGLERSVRAACAVEMLVDDHALAAGAMNCHVAEIRFGRVGVTPCFGLGRSASMGVPWTCTGDVLTAVALLISKALGGAAQYHELESYDYEHDEFVVASSGEHDLALAPDERPELIENAWFATDDCVGACARLSAPAGPATLLALADVGGSYRLIVARGEFTGRRFPSTGTANAGFRFERGLDGWRDWCLAGANHHSSASPGDLAPAAAACARYLAIDCRVV